MRGTRADRGRTPGRGAPLWTLLTALALVPVVGVVALTVVVARSRMTESASAERAEAAVRALAQLDTARSGVEQEVLPTLALSVIDDPATTESLGLPVALLAVPRQQALETQAVARGVTDDALARAGRSSYGAAAAQRAATDVRALRAQADSGALPPEDAYLRYLAISNALMHAQRAAASSATAEGLPGRTQRAIQDVELVAQLATTASRQMPLYLGAMFAGGDGGDGGNGLIGSRLASETGWLAYTDALDQMADLSQSALVDRWREVSGSSVFARLDALLTPAEDGSVTLMSVAELTPLLFQSADRDAGLTELVHIAADSAQSSAAADRDEARSRLTTTLLLVATVLVVALAVALRLGRSVTRSLKLLAGQAGQVSEGVLVRVEAGGPREVRTVSAALDSAVASLRRIQDQAEAVARGDLADSVLAEPLPGPLGEVVHASVQQIVHSVRQREELQSALAHQAAHDSLTQLPNRGQALTLVTSALHRGQRSGEMTGLLFVDLDGFKTVNDGHGHAMGDEVLRTVGDRLRATVRSGDVVCRLGGDEFVVLVEAVDDERALLELADRLIAAISAPIASGDQVVAIGASVGIAVSRDGSVDADVLFAEADTAAYRAKRHGRGRAEVFDDVLRAHLAERAELEVAIAHGLRAGEMELHYQPVMDVTSDRLSGYEALIRWERPGHGRVAPDEFIPAAEESQLICELDRWVLHEATRQLAEWRRDAGLDDGQPEPTVAVNISGRHLADRRVVADVADALAASGLPPHLLVLEVTETVLVDDPSAFQHLAALRELGVAIAIDDFGTGYTSIGQLRHMPVDTLKIDRSFIASVEPGHGELVALMIRAAHTFGLTVVAEGVEEPTQMARLRAEACDQAQGYLLSRPLPAAAAGALLMAAQAARATAAGGSVTG